MLNSELLESSRFFHQNDKNDNRFTPQKDGI